MWMIWVIIGYVSSIIFCNLFIKNSLDYWIIVALLTVLYIFLTIMALLQAYRRNKKNPK
jgi:ABC-type multidrug transport system permease subunit